MSRRINVYNGRAIKGEHWVGDTMRAGSRRGAAELFAQRHRVDPDQVIVEYVRTVPRTSSEVLIDTLVHDPVWFAQRMPERRASLRSVFEGAA